MYNHGETYRTCEVASSRRGRDTITSVKKRAAVPVMSWLVPT